MARIYLSIKNMRILAVRNNTAFVQEFYIILGNDMHSIDFITSNMQLQDYNQPAFKKINASCHSPLCLA